MQPRQRVREEEKDPRLFLTSTWAGVTRLLFPIVSLRVLHVTQLPGEKIWTQRLSQRAGDGGCKLLTRSLLSPRGSDPRPTSDTGELQAGFRTQVGRTPGPAVFFPCSMPPGCGHSLGLL